MISFMMEEEQERENARKRNKEMGKLFTIEWDWLTHLPLHTRAG